MLLLDQGSPDFFSFKQNINLNEGSSFKKIQKSRRDTSINYRHKENELLSILINLVFGILAVFHLAYLGVMFDQQDIQVVKGNSVY